MAQFTNQAQLSYNNTVVNSNVTVGEIIDTLTVTKTAVDNDYSRDSSIVYIISFVNSGATALTDLTATDDLGGYMQSGIMRYPLSYVQDSVRLFTNGTPGTAPEITDSEPLVFSGITVPAGGNVMIVYEADVTEFASPVSGSEITNSVSVSGSCITTPVTASESIAVSEEPILTITKSMDPTVISGCSDITYTFVIENYGNAPATENDNVTLTDVFTPILSDITVTYNGEALEAANYTYNEETGEFRTVPGTITVPSATYAQNIETGIWEVTPGTAVITVTGNL